MSHVCVIYNQSSGVTNSIDTIKVAFQEIGIKPAYVELSKQLNHRLDELRKNGYTTFVAAGGDGTVNAVASYVLDHKGTSLGVLPCGTLNHFAKDSGIPLDISEAVSLFKSPSTKNVDVGRVNGQLFVNNSSVGLYARIARNRHRRTRWLFKWLMTIVSAIRYISYPPTYKFRLTLDGESMRCHTPLIFIGNNKYNLGKLGFSERGSLSGGKLCVYIIATQNPLRLIYMAISTLLGRYKVSGFKEFDTKKLLIESGRKQLLVSYDGEVERLQTPLTYEILPRALKLVTGS